MKSYGDEDGELGGRRTGSDRVLGLAHVTGRVGRDEAVETQARLAALDRSHALERDLDAVLAAPLDVRRRVAFDAALERRLAADQRDRVLGRPHDHRANCRASERQRERTGHEE